MALINCPECKNQISNAACSCPHCGYQLIKEHTVNSSTLHRVEKIENFIHRHQTLIGILFLCLAAVFVILAITRFTNSSYQRSVENYSYYIAQAKETSSMSYGWLGSAYKSISNQWQDMANEEQAEIWFTRITAGVFILADIPLVIFGVKYIKKGRKKDGTN